VPLLRLRAVGRCVVRLVEPCSATSEDAFAESTSSSPPRQRGGSRCGSFNGPPATLRAAARASGRPLKRRNAPSPRISTSVRGARTALPRRAWSAGEAAAPRGLRQRSNEPRRLPPGQGAPASQPSAAGASANGASTRQRVAQASHAACRRDTRHTCNGRPFDRPRVGDERDRSRCGGGEEARWRSRTTAHARGPGATTIVNGRETRRAASTLPRLANDLGASGSMRPGSKIDRVSAGRASSVASQPRLRAVRARARRSCAPA